MKKRTKLLSLLFLLTGIYGTVHADDTEIYVDPEYHGGIPLVMFYLEYTPNMASTICTGVSDPDTMSDTDFAAACPEMASIRMYMAENDYDDGTVDQFEMTRAALKRVLAPLSGIQVGLLLPHNSNAGCAGLSETGCSGGGYIYQRFLSLQSIKDIVSDAVFENFNLATEDDLDHILANDANKTTLFNKLDALLSPQGGYSHPSQLKEVYFELFRYLTGQQVYNGHNGYTDFGTSSDFNIGDWQEIVSNKGDFNCATGSTCITPASDTQNSAEYTYINNAGHYDGDFAEKLNGNFASTYPFKWDTAAEDGSNNYLNPFTQDCQKVFVVNLVDGGGTGQNDADTDIALSFGSGGMNFTPLNNDPGFVQMVAWLHDVDLADGTINPDGGVPSPSHLHTWADKQNVQSYFIAKQNQQLDDAAVAGGSRFAYELTEDPSSVVDVLNTVLTQIQSVSTTFVSASIPVNVFNRSEVLDNVFIALFQTDENGSPSWVGNIKKLKLHIEHNDVTDKDSLTFIDANGAGAIGGDGRINYNAVTYWTNTSAYDVVAFNPDDDEVSGTDGRSVNRGGSGHKIPNFLNDTNQIGNVSMTNVAGGRTLYSEVSNSLVDLDLSNITDFWPSIYNTTAWSDSVTALTGVYSTDATRVFSNTPCDSFFGGTFHAAVSGTSCYIAQYAANVIAYIRGKDVFDENINTIKDETRRWIFGDPLHSRPLPINYGKRNGHTTDLNPDIRIVAGSNDGFFRMFRNTDGSGTELGKEVWAFMPREVMGVQKILMENVPTDNYFHPYGVDGAPVAYMLDRNHNGTIDIDAANPAASDKVWVFFGMRRGGSNYYALDISNPDTPVFKWKITNSGDFAELGLTFSTPVVTELDWGAGPKPVLIFGGGYDTNKDTKNAVGTDDSKGNAIYVVDADSGALVWKAVPSGTASETRFVHADLVDSIPSNLAVVDTTGDGLADRAYVGDTGGTVWRVDFIGTDRSDWNLTKLLVAGRHYNSTLADDRRFFHAPDIVPAKDTAPFDGVLIGSGNRANPQSLTTHDYFYMIKDRDISYLPQSNTDTWLLHDSDTDTETLVDVTSDCLQEDPSNCSVNADLGQGWKLSLIDQGEKSLASPITYAGIINFNTYVPSASASSEGCGPSEGTGYNYDVDLQNGNAVYNKDTTEFGQDEQGETTELGQKDRRGLLDSKGIPSESVYISYREGDTKVTCIMTPDFKCEESGKKAGWRTFWFKKEE